jgi:hypothetical protein
MKISLKIHIIEALMFNKLYILPQVGDTGFFLGDVLFFRGRFGDFWGPMGML